MHMIAISADCVMYIHHQPSSRLAALRYGAKFSMYSRLVHHVALRLVEQLVKLATTNVIRLILRNRQLDAE